MKARIRVPFVAPFVLALLGIQANLAHGINTTDVSLEFEFLFREARITGGPFAGNLAEEDLDYTILSISPADSDGVFEQGDGSASNGVTFFSDGVEADPDADEFPFDVPSSVILTTSASSATPGSSFASWAGAEFFIEVEAFSTGEPDFAITFTFDYAYTYGATANNDVLPGGAANGFIEANAGFDGINSVLIDDFVANSTISSPVVIPPTSDTGTVEFVVTQDYLDNNSSATFEFILDINSTTFVNVPEPSSAVLLTSLGAMILTFRRGRRTR